MKITGYTQLYGVIATPIKHSISPMMHNLAFELCSIDARYLAFDVKEESFDDAIKGMIALDVQGFNVSMPYKGAIIPYLSELTKEASLIGAVNTVKNVNGRLIGHNSDGIGLIRSLEADDFSIKDKTIVVLGVGGAARAIILSMALHDAREIIIYNRNSPSIEKAREMTSLIQEKTNCQASFQYLENKEQLKEDLKRADLLINATNVGMAPHTDRCLIPDESYLHQQLYVVDIIYNPAKTKLLELASKAGCKYQNGMGMLLYQGAESFHFWTNQQMPIDKVKEAINHD